MTEETILKQPVVYWWYTSLIEFHDFTSFEVRELAHFYDINPSHIPSYQHFRKMIEAEKQKEIEKINCFTKINNITDTELDNPPIWIEIILNENPNMIDIIKKNNKPFQYNFSNFKSYYEFCIKIIKKKWHYERNFAY